MRRNARLFAVMLGVGVAGAAWAAPKPQGAVGPHNFAVKTQKAVGPGVHIVPAVRTEKAVGPSGIIRRAVRTEKAVGPGYHVTPAVRTEKAVAQEEKRAEQGPLLDLNAGF